MPAPTKPRKKPINTPTDFRESMISAMPVSLPVPQITFRNNTLMTAGSFAVLAVLLGILAGLVLRSELTEVVAVKPGSVAAVTDPQFDRIIQAKTVAATPSQTLQVTSATMSLQPTTSAQILQAGQDINSVQIVLSAYDAQGSVNGPAIR